METMGPISSPKQSGSEKRFLTTEPKPRLNTLHETIFLNGSKEERHWINVTVC